MRLIETVSKVSKKRKLLSIGLLMPPPDLPAAAGEEKSPFGGFRGSFFIEIFSI